VTRKPAESADTRQACADTLHQPGKTAAHVLSFLERYDTATARQVHAGKHRRCKEPGRGTMHGNQDGYAAIVRILVLISIVFVQVSCASSADEPQVVKGNSVSTDTHQPQSRKLALLVGIDKYQHAHIGNLNGAVNDVHSMKRLLVERFGFPDDNQHLRVLTNSDATRKAILKGMLSAVERSGPY